MLDKRETRTFENVSANDVSAILNEYWAGRNYELSYLAPTVIRGKSREQSLGLKREFQICLFENKETIVADMTFAASLTDEGLIGGAVLLVFAWPVAAGLGAISYYQYDKAVVNEISAFWSYMSDRVAAMVRARDAVSSEPVASKKDAAGPAKEPGENSTPGKTH